MTPAQRSNEFLLCVETLKHALEHEMKKRTMKNLDWIDNERSAIDAAAIKWACEHESCVHVPTSKIRIAESRAVGHGDYVSKFALGVAEALYDISHVSSIMAQLARTPLTSPGAWTTIAP